MPKRVPEAEKKEFQLGFRITRLQRERLAALISKIKSINRRVEASEIYEELMSLREPEFVTRDDREFLLGIRTSLSETKHGPYSADDPIRSGDHIRFRPSKKKGA